MMWDIMGGVARRNWARNKHSIETAVLYNRKSDGQAHITIPYLVSDELIKRVMKKQ